MLRQVVYPHVMGVAVVDTGRAYCEPAVVTWAEQVRHFLVVDLQKAAFALVLHKRPIRVPLSCLYGLHVPSLCEQHR